MCLLQTLAFCWPRLPELPEPVADAELLVAEPAVSLWPLGKSSQGLLCLHSGKTTESLIHFLP